METTRVEVRSAWLSKVNWTQVVAIGASALAVKGIDMDASTQVAVVMTIQGVQGVATWIFKTFFTSTVSPSSVPPASLPIKE